MDVFFDGSFLENKSGIGRDSRVLLDAAKAAFHDHTVIVVYPTGIKGKLSDQPRSKVHWRFSQAYSLIRQNCIQLNLPSNSIFIQSHLSHFTISTSDKIHVLRVHDIFPITNPEWFRKFSRHYFRISLKGISSQSILLFDSKTTKKAVFEKLGRKENQDRVLLCPIPALNNDPCAECFGCRFESFPKKYFLSIGTIEPRKNYDFLIDVWEELKSENPELQHDLVIIGSPGWKTSRLQSRIKKQKGVIWIPRACDYALQKILSKGEALVSASLDEGFGLPPGEAQALGIPIYISDIPVYREIYSDADAFFAINNTDDLKNLLITNSQNLNRNLKKNLYEERYKDLVSELRKLME